MDVKQISNFHFASCWEFLPVLICVVCFLHFISAASGTRVTVAMGASFGPMIPLGAPGGAFDFLCLCSRRFFICSIAGCCRLQLFFVGLPCLSLYLLLDGRVWIFSDWIFVVPCLAHVWSGGLLIPGVWAGLRPAWALLFDLAVLWRVWRGQALGVWAVVGST